MKTWQIALLVLLACITYFILGVIIPSRDAPTMEQTQKIVAARQVQEVREAADREANERKAKSDQDKRYNQNMANNVIRSITYVQDPRTTPPTCYAYFWKGRFDGGPALATVPCKAIPFELLTVANVPPSTFR